MDDIRVNAIYQSAYTSGYANPNNHESNPEERKKPTVKAQTKAFGNVLDKYAKEE